MGWWVGWLAGWVGGCVLVINAVTDTTRQGVGIKVGRFPSNDWLVGGLCGWKMWART